MIILSIDPGVTTGWALLDMDGEIIETGNFVPEDVFEGIERVVTTWQGLGEEVIGVIERFPLMSQGKLGDTLRQVVLALEAIMLARRVVTRRVTPGVWKTSSTRESEHEWGGQKLTPHQRDAIRLGRYALARGLR